MEGAVMVHDLIPKPNRALKSSIVRQFGSQRAFAVVTGFSAVHVSNVCTGYSEPGQGFIKRACKVLGTTPEELGFKGNGQRD